MNGLVMELRAAAEAMLAAAGTRSGTYPTARPTARPGEGEPVAVAVGDGTSRRARKTSRPQRDR